MVEKTYFEVNLLVYYENVAIEKQLITKGLFFIKIETLQKASMLPSKYFYLCHKGHRI